MARASSRKEVLSLGATELFQAARNAVEKLNWNIVEADPYNGKIFAKTKMGFKSWGEDIYVRISPEPAGSTIEVTSRLSSQLRDWGKNTDNQKDFFAQLGFEILKLHLMH